MEKEINWDHNKKCQLCGMSNIEEPYHHETCEICGWMDDGHSKLPDEDGGPNEISFNQYKDIWHRHKQRISKIEKGKFWEVWRIFEEEGGVIEKHELSFKEKL